MTVKTQPVTKSNSSANANTIKKLLWVAPLAVVTSAIANLGLYAASGALFPAVTAWPGAGVGQIVGASGVYLFIGAIVFALTARLAARPARTYATVATVGLLLSMVLPMGAGFGYGAPGAPPAGLATVITLCLMHVVSYAISVPMFNRLALN